MAHKIRWSPRVALNFEDICNHISKDSRYYASIFANRINHIIKNIPTHPRSGRIVPEYNDDNLREKIYENYRIVYRIKQEFIEIVAICHSARMLKEIL